MALAVVSFRHAYGEDRATAERSRGIRRVRSSEPSVAEQRPRTDDAGADPADGDFEADGFRPDKRRRRGDAVDITVEARADRDRDLDETPLLQRANGVRQGDGKGAARQLEIRGTDAVSDTGAHGNDLAVQRAADDRHASQDLGRAFPSPRHA